MTSSEHLMQGQFKSCVYGVDIYEKQFNVSTIPGNVPQIFIARKIIFSFTRRPEKMVFPKKFALEYDLSSIIEKDNISFTRKYGVIPQTENER